MNLSKLQKQLTKDIKKSPGKAAVLGGLVLVALYAWAPLIFGASKPEVAKKNPMAASATQAPSTPVSLSPADTLSAPTTEAKIPWDQIATWIEQDPDMSPVDRGLMVNDPFSRSQPVAELAEADPIAETQSAMPTDQRPMPDLTVSSTMVGTRRRVAVINGRPYCEGEPIPVAAGGVVVLSEVRSRHVVLERNGQRFDVAVRDGQASEAP